MKKQSRAIQAVITLASNPVARAIERAQLKAHNKAMQAEMRSMQDGALCSGLVKGVGQSVGMAMKTIEGWDDPDSVGDALEAAQRAMISMHNADADEFFWRSEHTALMCDAIDCATQVLAGMPAEANIRAKLWHDGVVMRAIIKKAATA